MNAPILTIAAINGFSLLFISFIALVLGLCWVIKNRRYSEALLTVAVVGGAISMIWGMALVGDNIPDKWLAGAIMLAAGLGVLASIGLGLRK
jgi:hypothetical protein